MEYVLGILLYLFITRIVINKLIYWTGELFLLCEKIYKNADKIISYCPSFTVQLLRWIYRSNSRKTIIK